MKRYKLLLKSFVCRGAEIKEQEMIKKYVKKYAEKYGYEPTFGEIFNAYTNGDLDWLNMPDEFEDAIIEEAERLGLY